MVRPDFIINYDPLVDNEEDVSTRIISSMLIKRILNNKPAVVFVQGDSGEGKSYTVMRIQEKILESLENHLKAKKPIQCKDLSLSLVDCVGDVNVHTPLEYPKKMQEILYNKRLKHVPMIAVHEARNLIRAKDWGNFVSVTISDVNAMSRKIKPLIFFIVSQFIRDITTDVRYTLNYIIECDRPYNSKTHARIYRIWKDSRDIEKPKLRKSRLWGYLKYPNGKRRKFIPTYFEINLADKESLKKFDEDDYNAKSSILKNKFKDLINDMEKNLGTGENKVDSIVEYYVDHPEQIPSIGKKRGNKWYVNKEFRALFYNLDDDEIKEFQTRIKEDMGVVENE